MFALEYAGWFAIMLPGLARLRVPIPLGGTSNHFRIHVLRSVGGWDAYNVTEDADVGLRLARAGHRTAPLDSTTFEEANARLGSWVRQRSRWFKGYMQTALVHTREPLQFARAVGLFRYLASILFVGGAPLAALVAPLLWGLGLVWWLTGTGPDGPFYNLFFVASIIMGNAILTILAVLAALRTGERRLIAWAATVWAYGLLMSPGAYKGIGQLLSGRSWHWEKTDHGTERHETLRRPYRVAFRPAFVHAILALIVLAVSACAAFANPWLKRAGGGEVTATLRDMESIDGFAAEPASNGAIDLHAEYGATDAITLVFDGEAKEDGDIAGSLLAFAGAGARVSLLRWDTGVLSVQGELGSGALRELPGQSFFSSMHGAGEARVLFGQDFSLLGDHAWIAVEGAFRWHGGPPADEAVFDVTLGLQPREDLFFMMQSFGVDSIDDAFDGYRRFKSDKLQISAAYEITPQIWVQVGAIASVYGDDSGNAGGIAALWWRF